MRNDYVRAILCVLAWLIPANVHAQQSIEEDDKAVLSLVVENDLTAGTDQNYTSGVRFSWLSAESKTPNWARWAANNLLPLSKEGNKRIGLSFGQNIYTPQDKTQQTLITNDRPYAGWLYGSLGMISDTGKILDTAVLTLGVVGPYSFARETQTFVHRVIDSPQSRGWHNQLKTEPGVVLTVERKWRNLYEFSPFGVGLDATPHVGMNLGNINTDVSVGTMFRLGYDLPQDYGPPRIRPSLPGSDFFVPAKTLGGYLFAGVEGRAVGRNIFLDGNTFRDGPSVDKKWTVGSLQCGLAMTYGNTRISYTHIFMTKEFKQQVGAESFGALTLSYRF